MLGKGHLVGAPGARVPKRHDARPERAARRGGERTAQGDDDSFEGVFFFLRREILAICRSVAAVVPEAQVFVSSARCAAASSRLYC
jgi:hypothetical protein